MADLRSAGIFAVLRAAAHEGEERYLVGAANASERGRIAGALGAEGRVTQAPSTAAAIERLGEGVFELAVLDTHEHAGFDPLAAAREVAPYADLVFLVEPDPGTVGALLAGGAAGVIPRPLPESEALLRAHLRWLAACRRSRTRARQLGLALARHGEELLETEPALAGVLKEVLTEPERQPTVMVMGDAELVRLTGGRPVEVTPDVVVVAIGAADDLRERLAQARRRAAGAAVVVLDHAPDAARLCGAIYDGARAYLSRQSVRDLGRVVASTAERRQSEVNGRRLIETLARFGVLETQSESPGRSLPALAASVLDDARSPASQVVPSGHQVLVVDDEPVVLTVLREALRRGGYRVTTAASAEEAIALLHRKPFDLVLTDKNLPGASGLEVLKVARALRPPPAVVLITGYSSYDSAVEALETGAYDYVEKPIRDLESLRFRVRRALSRRDEELSRTEVEGDKVARVLLVEVEGGRRQLMAEYLGRTCRVTAVADGDEALRRLQHESFDVVLADRNLPGLSGLRVIEQAKRLLPHCASVLYTAYPSFETVKEAFELGVDAFCVRPSEDLKNLAEKVEGAFRSRGGILLG